MNDCCETFEDGCVCTEPVGHAGDHIAGSAAFPTRPWHRWPNDADGCVMTTEWAVRWPADHSDPGQQRIERPDLIESDGGEAFARGVHRLYRYQGVELVRCEVRRGPWVVTS